ncbi:unnamed protein product [Callosobruchus maculatus]|uniref:Golgi apparatus protein 1 n=1 Tax=Callosobruchus maculatus TaxID=64391 RepID=A0A653DG07_CALMS|nr:unnamed protein product [Callosobruchus maculatus]
MYIPLFFFITSYLGNSVEAVSSPRSNNSILQDSRCSIIRSICNDSPEYDDISIMECLISAPKQLLKGIDIGCQNVIWKHTFEITKDENVKKFLSKSCSKKLEQVNCETGLDDKHNYLKCVINSMRELENQHCNQALLRLENIAFTDYRWIQRFLDQCVDDIQSLKCGLVDIQDFSQIKVVSCLQDNILQLKDGCKKEVFKLSEIQSNSIKLDALLYTECAEDHARYCSHLEPGSGRVFSCLMKEMNTDQTKLRPRCQQQMLRRQKLIAQDYRVSKGLLRACKDEIRKVHCRKQSIVTDKTAKLAQILLCLENAVRNGTYLFGRACTDEMKEHRRMLMENYNLSPEIVHACRGETMKYCSGYSIGGKTIHCLLNLAVKSRDEETSKLSDSCARALEDLIRETDAGDEWSVDPVLQALCGPTVQVACREIARESDNNQAVLSCLLDAIAAGSDAMTDECEDALLEIQYFVARDFKLDSQLFKACREDAAKFCHYFDATENEEGPSYGPQVLPCLYRQAYQRNSPIQSECKKQVKRVMRQRAISVSLHPEIEEACVRDLAAHCKDAGVKRGDEIQCLQDNLEELDDECHKAVETYTEIEAQQISLNPIIIKYCGKILETLCNTNPSDDDGTAMDCLLKKKNSHEIKSVPSCRAAIEHFQLISVKDYRFTYKFKVSCKAYAMKLCGNAVTKNEVVACLSEHILNSTVQGLRSSISRDCRQQLKQQIFQQRENIDFDPNLKRACLMDITKFCRNVPAENAQVLECLQTVPHHQLTNKCSKEIFKIQVLEVQDNTVDYALITMCADTIDQFCPQHEKENVFNCLKANKDEKGFNKNCRMIVMHRLLEQHSNNILSPSLQRNCQLDIEKFCRYELVTNNERKRQYSTIECLKKVFKQGKLTSVCQKEVAEILRERALDVNLNPLIRVVCKDELATICKTGSDNVDDDTSGRAEECLKEALLSHSIHTPECRVEVANMIEESQADIQADPLLQKACALDLLTYCGNIEAGNGRHIQCLKTIMEDQSRPLSPKCRKKLKERINMYRNAAQVLPPSDFQELYHQVSLSPSKNYFALVLFTFLGMVFLIGVFCGRTRRYSQLKNK